MNYAKLFVDAGFETDLYNNEQKALNRCSNLIDYIEEHKRTPKVYATNAVEKSLAAWHIAMKSVKKGTNTKGNKWYPSVLEYAISKGYSTLFDSNTTTRAMSAVNRCHALGKWIVENNKTPTMATNDAVEKSLAQFIAQSRRKKAGKTIGKWNAELETIMKSYGHPDIFEIKRDFKIPYVKCQSVIDFKNNNGRYPNPASNDKAEKHLGIWVTLMRRSKNGAKNATSKFYPQIQQMIAEQGYPYAFDNKSLQLEKAHVFCKWYIKNNRLPNFVSKNTDEVEICTLYKWLAISYNGEEEEEEEGEYKDIIIRVFSDMGIKDVDSILKVNLKELALNKVLDELIEFCDVNKRPPHKLIEAEANLSERWAFWSSLIVGYQKSLHGEFSRERYRQLGLVKGYREFIIEYFGYIQDRLTKANLGYLFLTGSTQSNNVITKCIDYCMYSKHPELFDETNTRILTRWYLELLKSKRGLTSTVQWVPLIDEMMSVLYVAPTTPEVKSIDGELNKVLLAITEQAREVLSPVECTRVSKLMILCKYYSSIELDDDYSLHTIQQWNRAYSNALINSTKRQYDWIPLFDDVMDAFELPPINTWPKKWYSEY